MSQEDSSPEVFDEGPGGNKSLEILVGSCLGMMDLFPLWILLKGGGLSRGHPRHLPPCWSGFPVLYYD